MKTVWTHYHRELIWIAVITAIAGYLSAGWGAHEMREAGAAPFGGDWMRNTLVYGTGVWLVLFVLVVGVVIPRKAYFADEATYVRPAKLFISGIHSDVLEEMHDDDARRRSSNFGMWGTDNDLPPPWKDDF